MCSASRPTSREHACTHTNEGAAQPGIPGKGSPFVCPCARTCSPKRDSGDGRCGEGREHHGERDGSDGVLGARHGGTAGRRDGGTVVATGLEGNCAYVLQAHTKNKAVSTAKAAGLARTCVRSRQTDPPAPSLPLSLSLSHHSCRAHAHTHVSPGGLRRTPLGAAASAHYSLYAYRGNFTGFSDTGYAVVHTAGHVAVHTAGLVIPCRAVNSVRAPSCHPYGTRLLHFILTLSQP